LLDSLLQEIHDEANMSLKIKSFNNFDSVLNVNNQKESTPIFIELDVDNCKKHEQDDAPVKNNAKMNGCEIMGDNEGLNIVENILNQILEKINDNPAESRLIVVDDVGVAVVERIQQPPQKNSSKHDRFNVDNDKLKTSIGIPTLVLDEDEGPGDVAQAHEIDIDDDIVQVQQIACDRALENESKVNPSDTSQTQEHNDEIVILSDKESDHKSQQEQEDEMGKGSGGKQIPETVTVLKTPIQPKKNKRLVKIPFKRTNDLLCQKVDKMIRCGKPDIQLLRSLLNHLSENRIGELLAKLVSNDEMETMSVIFESSKVKGDVYVNNEEKDNINNNEVSLDDDDASDKELHKNSRKACTKLPDGISINFVNPKQDEDKDNSTEKKANSVDMINTIIRSEVSAAAHCSDLAPSRFGVPLNIRADSIVELEVTPPPTPEKPETVVTGGLRIANIKNLMAPKDDIIIPEAPIRISNTVSLSKHTEDDDISIIEENLSPATITRNLPNVSISRAFQSQDSPSSHPRNLQSSHARSSNIGSSNPTSSKPSGHPKPPPNAYYDGRGKLRSSLTHKLLRPNLDPPPQNQQHHNNMPIPMNELIRRYLYPSGSGGVSVGTPMENPWGLPRDLAMYEELLRTNMTSTTDNAQYAAYAAAYEELIKSFMSASPENYAKIVAKYNIFSSERAPLSDHDRPSTSKLTPPSQEQSVTVSNQAGQTSRLSTHQRTPVIVSAKSFKSKGQYKECNIGSGATLTPVHDSQQDLHSQAGPSGVRNQGHIRSVDQEQMGRRDIGQTRAAREGKKRNYKVSSGESSSEESSESDDEVPSADEFVVEQAETDKMKAGRRRKRETEIPGKRRRGDRREKSIGRRDDGKGGISGKRRGKITAMRHNPTRKGQVTVESTDSETESRIRKMNVNATSVKEKNYTDGSSCEGTSNVPRPRKTNINKAALKMTRVESESSDSWMKSESSDSSDDN